MYIVALLFCLFLFLIQMAFQKKPHQIRSSIVFTSKIFLKSFLRLIFDDSLLLSSVCFLLRFRSNKSNLDQRSPIRFEKKVTQINDVRSTNCVDPRSMSTLHFFSRQRWQERGLVCFSGQRWQERGLVCLRSFFLTSVLLCFGCFLSKEHLCLQPHLRKIP